VSDILHNCTVKSVKNVSFYRTGFQAKMVEIFTDLHATYKNIPSRMKAESFKQRVVSCFKAWEDWALYPPQFLIQLQNIFLGLVSTSSPEPEEDAAPVGRGRSASNEESDEDVDGVPLDGAALLKGRRETKESDEDSLDGAPLGSLGEPEKGSAGRAASGFMASKWETVDPEEVKKGVVTTSKWETEEKEELVKARKALMGSVASKWDDREDDIDGVPMGADSDSGEVEELDPRKDEERRSLLREVEVRVMQYQDELESGRKTVKAGWTVAEQVEHYRRKLMKKTVAEQETPKRGRSPSASPERKSEKSKKKKRRRTRSSSRSRSRTPERKKDKRRRSRSSSSSPERGSKRSNRDRAASRSRSPRRSKKSRSRSPRKHKKKSRH